MCFSLSAKETDEMKTDKQAQPTLQEETGGSWQFKFLIGVIVLGIVGIIVRALGLV